MSARFCCLHFLGNPSISFSSLCLSLSASALSWRRVLCGGFWCRCFCCVERLLLHNANNFAAARCSTVVAGAMKTWIQCKVNELSRLLFHKVIWKRRLCGLLHLTEHIFSYINNAGHVKAFFRIDWCILIPRLWTTVLQVPPIRGVRNRFCPGLAMQKKGARLRRQDSKWTQARRVAIRNSF